MSNTNTNTEIGKSVARNVSVIFGAQVVTWGSSLVLLYFLPRYLGSADFGRLYLALSIRMMLGLFIDFGGNYLITKEVARSEETGVKILGTYILIRVALWVFSIGLILGFSRVLGYSEHVHFLILILAIGKLWEGGSTALSAYFQGVEKMKYPSIGNIAEKFFVASIAILVLLLGATSTAVAIVMSVGAFLNLAVVFWFSRKIIHLSYRFDREIFTLLRSGMPFFLFSLFSVIYYRIDAVMLNSLTSEQVTGWYGGAFRFFDIVMVLPIIYKTAIFPVFSKLWDNKDGVLENTIGQSLRLMLILGIPVSFLIFLFSTSIVQFFMGLEEFTPSVIVLRIFAVSIPFIYIDIILGSAIMGAANKQKAWAVTGFAAIAINIIINYLLIPYTQNMYDNGGIGAAIATLFTELFVMGSAFFLLPKEYLQTFKSSFIYKPIAASILMGFLVLLLFSTRMYWMLSFIIAGFFYVTVLLLLKTFDHIELDEMKRFISSGHRKLISYLK